MAGFSDEKINQIRDRIDIVALVSEYVKLKRSGSSYLGLCPFHNEKTPSFTVSQEKGLFHCFGCGAGGDIFTFVMKKEGLTYPEAVRFLANKAGITLDESRENKKENKEKERLYEINHDIAMYFYKNLLTEKRPQAYLVKRGLKSNILNKFLLGYAKDSRDDLLNYCLEKDYLLDDLLKLGLISRGRTGTYYDKFRDRLIFPIINQYGKVIGFGGRAIGDAMPKYLNSPENPIFQKRYNLYGLNTFKKQKKREAILVEGYMDVISLNNHGIETGLASLGTSLTSDQAKLLKRYADDIYICYDGDSAGQAATKRAIDIFAEEGISPKIISLKDNLDPDEFIKKYGRDEFLKEMEGALDIYNYQYEKILEVYAGSKDNEKLEKLNLFLDFLAKIPSPLTQEIFLNKVAGLFNVEKDTLKDSLKKYNNKMTESTKAPTYKRPENKVMVEEPFQDYSTNELEVLRLYKNQREDYLENYEIFDNFLENADILAVKKSLEEEREETSGKYEYIYSYIENTSNKIDPAELIDKIELENKKKLLKKIRDRN